MKTAFIKYCKDKESFNIPKAFGAKVIEIDNPEEIDFEINKLYLSNWKRVVITNEVANFSGDIFKKYSLMQNFNIIIAPKK